MRTGFGVTLFVVLTFLAATTAKAQGNGYSFSRAITIDHTKVPNTDQTNFPVLISGTHTDQRLEAPGSSTLDTVSYTFDSNGRPATFSGPCATGYTGTCSTPQTAVTCDAGRPTQVADSGGGSTTYQYIGNDVLETIGPAPSGENTKRKQLTSNTQSCSYTHDDLARIAGVNCSPN